MLGRGNFQIDPAKLRCAAAPPAAQPAAPPATAASTSATADEQKELAELKEQITKWSKQIRSALNIDEL
jgi:hypothetical protein